MKYITLTALVTCLLQLSCGDPRPSLIKLTLTPTVSPPSEEIILKYDENSNKPLSLDSLKILVGKEVADLVDKQRGTIRFLLPEISSGREEVILLSNNKMVGKTDIKVKPHPTKKILFAWQKNKAIQIGEKLTNDSIQSINISSKSGNMLYAVYSLNEDLILSGEIISPPSAATGQEIFPSPNGSILKDISKREGSFSVLVPNLDTTIIIKLFKAGAIPKQNKAAFLRDTNLIQTITIQNN